MWCVVYHSKHIYSMFKRNVCYTYEYILYPKKEVECEKVIAWDIIIICVIIAKLLNTIPDRLVSNALPRDQHQ